ncbi:class I SAM-dependent methyltransferase [Amycolatopsis sp. NPDC049688]|uniref:class I SAM-dependent methyltransferase n=1 Tax=Amycolatopsis sp. NPDC049688 TaxID=3154733 RepID=UPI00341D06AC
MSVPGEPWTKETLLETLQAFKRTSLLKAAIELRVFDVLADGPRDAGEVSALIGAPERATAVFLGALAAAGIVDSDGAKFSLAEGSGPLLVTGSPQYGGGAARLVASDGEWDALRDLAAVVRAGGSGVDAATPDFPYWRDFAAQPTFVARKAAAVFAEAVEPWLRDRPRPSVLDVGCGHALPSLTLAQRVPALRLTALDGADVLEHARENADRMGVADRVTWLPGDAFTASPGGTFDLVLLANFLPLLSEERGTELLRRLAGRVAPGGRIAVLGFTVNDRPPAEEHASHMLSLLMLAWTRGGRAHSAGTYRRMFAATGFGAVTTHAVPGVPAHLLIAGRPG